MLDGSRAAGNPDVHVRMSALERGKRLGPLDMPMGEEVESSSLKFLTNPPVGWDFAQAVSRYIIVLFIAIITVRHLLNKNHFSNFIIEKNGNFEGCLIGAVKPLKINGRLKTFMFTNIQGV